MKKQLLLAVLSISLLGTSPALAQQAQDRFSGSARGRDYVRSIIGPTALLGIAASTALDEIRKDPPQWNLGKRALSNAGRLAVQESFTHGLAAIMDRSTWYYPCSCTDTGARMGHAFGEAFTDHERNGATHLSVSKIGGAYVGAWAESTWRPGRNTGEVLVAGATTLIGSGILNLWREFVH